MENILVSIRVRPLSKQETAKGSPWKLTPKTISLSSAVSSSGHTYNFDRVFDPNSKNADVYDAHTKKIISSAVQGFNGTIFAYGQTSSGKTFTMRGSTEEPGIIPLAIQDVFRTIEETQNREFLLRVSYMEIYNEEIKDLLAPENCKLQIHENFERGIFVAGLREEIVVGPEQVLELMEFGEAHRHVGETNMNVHSSRSHAIFRMVIESRDRSQDDPSDRELLQSSDPVRVSHLNLVDLAGSERVSKSGAEGARLKEGTHINKSLMTLGNVINKLSEGIEKQGGHVPYRDSKLTRILQPALGGNARTVIICNVTPALVHVDETRGTLHFASRANRVTNCAQVNEIVTDAALLKRQKKEIAELRQKLQNQESPSDQFEEEILNLRNELLKTELERERMALELQEFQKAQAERERRIKEQEQKIENLSSMVINSAVDDREFEKRSKRNNRRETWCARPQSGLPLGPNIKRPLKDSSTTVSYETSNQINKERSFGLPPPFETLMEEDEGLNMFTREASSPLDDGFEEGFSIDDGFSLPEPGPQSSVANRRRRSSNEWIMANELEQQLLDLQGQYDTLQCDYVIKMNEKETEIDKLKRELSYCQSTLVGSGKNDKHKKVLDPAKRGKSLDSWKESESIETIKQLRAQVENLEMEKLYMERELQRLSEQAREQSETSRQELEEVWTAKKAYEELNLARESLAKLNIQLDKKLQHVQLLQTEKQENAAAFLQLSLALKDLKSEVDNIKAPSSALESSVNESLQLLTSNVQAFQECLADAKDMSSPVHFVYKMYNAKLDFVTPKAGILKELGVEHHDSTDAVSLGLDEKYDHKEVKEILPAPVGLGVQTDQAEHVLNQAVEGAQPLRWGLQGRLNQLDDVKDTEVDESGGNIDSEKVEELQVGDHKDCEIKHCCSVSGEQKPNISDDFNRLQEERDILHAAVDNLHMQIEHASTEKESLLLRKTVLQEELEKLKLSLQTIEDEKNALARTNRNPNEDIGNSSGSRPPPKEWQSTDSDELHPVYGVRSQLLTDEHRQSLEAVISKLREEKESLSDALASVCYEAKQEAVHEQTCLLKESALGEKIESLKLALQTVEEEHQKCPKILNEAFEELDRQETGMKNLATKLVAARSLALQKAGLEKCDDHRRIDGANDKLCILESEVDWAVEELKTLYETVENIQGALKQAASEGERLLLRESALSQELDQMKTSLELMADEKVSLMSRSSGTESELDSRRAEMDEIARKIESVQYSHDGTEKRQRLPNLVLEVDRLIQANKSLKDMVDVLHDSVLHARKDTDRLLSREESLVEEVVSLKLSLQAVEDDRNLLTRVSQERLAEIEKQKMEFDDTVRVLELTRQDHANAEMQILDLNTLLSQKLEEQEALQKRLKGLEEDKDKLTITVAEADTQLQTFREGAAEALREMEGWQQRYQTESTQHRVEMTSLRKELSTMKALPGSLSKERDSLQRDLEKAKSKMKDIEAKYKTSIQDKSKLETEKLNMEKELKHLRQSTLLQRDISRRDSVADQRRQSTALCVNKTKHQLSSVEHALQTKTEEVESLTYDLHVSHESYAKLEFAMAEAESCSKERLTELEGALVILKNEKDASIGSIKQLQNELEAMNEQCRAKGKELEELKIEVVSLKEKLHETEDERIAAEALATSVSKDKEDIVEELLDAHMSFQSQRAELTAQAQESREKCNGLSLDIVLLTEELQKLKKLQEEASDAKRLLEDSLQKALEANSDMSLSHHKQLKQLEEDAASFKDRCRELEQHIESAGKRELELRISASMQLEQLRVELQRSRMNLTTSKDAERTLSLECQDLLTANTKLQFGLDATKDRLEIFETRLDEADWELTEFKSLLQKAGFVRGDEWNLVSLQQFQKHIQSQNDEARKLEAELASKKMEMIELEVQFESVRAHCEKYQEEIRYLKSKVLTPEQETGVRELVHQNKKLQAQLERSEEELRANVKAKEVSLNALQMTMESLQVQNTQLRKDLTATKSELESTQHLHKLAVRAGALGKSTMSSSKPLRPEKLQSQASSQSAISLPTKLVDDHSVSPFRAESTESTFMQSAISEYRHPLSENPSNASPGKSERKRARLFPNSERSKLSRSMGIGPRYFTLPDSGSHADLNKENFPMQ